MAVFDELLTKLAKGEKLNPLEVDEFQREAKALSDMRNIVSSWLQPGSNVPKFQSFSVTSGPDWQQSPLHSYTFSMLTNLSTTHDTDTYITFDYSVGESKFFVLDAGDMTKLKILRGGAAWHIDGYPNWTANATGYRKLHIEGFNHAGVSLGNTPVYTMPGSSLVDNVTPINYTSSWLQFANLSYLKFFVRQTSGGALELKDLVLNIHIV